MRVACFILVGVLMALPAQAAEFKVHRSDSIELIVSMTGMLESGDSKKLQRILRSNPFAQQKFLKLNSTGGWVQAALEVGIIVRFYGIQTVIPKNALCISACSMVFVAGWDDKRFAPARYKHLEGHLGVHRPYIENFQAADPAVLEAVRSYLAYMKAGDQFYALTIATSPRQIRLIEISELKAMGDYKVLGLSKAQKVRKPRKKPPQYSRARTQRELERWRRSLLESSD